MTRFSRSVAHLVERNRHLPGCPVWFETVRGPSGILCGGNGGRMSITGVDTLAIGSANDYFFVRHGISMRFLPVLLTADTVVLVGRCSLAIGVVRSADGATAGRIWDCADSGNGGRISMDGSTTFRVRESWSGMIFCFADFSAFWNRGSGYATESFWTGRSESGATMVVDKMFIAVYEETV